MAALALSLAGQSRASWLLRALLQTYAAVLFSRSQAVGLLLLGATAIVPRTLLAGGLAVLCALLFGWVFDLDLEALQDGSYSLSALLLGLGIVQTLGLSPATIVLLILLAPCAVLLTAALRSALAPLGLPVLSLSFLLLFCLLLVLAPALGLYGVAHSVDASGDGNILSKIPHVLTIFLRSLGAIFFLPRCDVGILILLAMLVHSRIFVLLAGLSGMVVLGLSQFLPALGASDQCMGLVLNAVFAAIAIGAVWFVPSPSAVLLALFAVLISLFIGLGGGGIFFRWGLPILIVPFHGAVYIVLLAARQRTWDRRPKSVDFAPGTPEQNLAYFRTRLLRFRWLYPTRFGLPVRGTWICTQGENGPLSHQGRFRHAFDFEVQGVEGKLHEGEGAALKDYSCFRLPVVAAAPGTVVKVENLVPDNEIGTLNLQQNWGNYVILHHQAGLYSLVAHLQQGSVKVALGQVVRAGELLGLCGNSGRSARPHVHFQLQSGSRVGDSTLPCRFSDVILHEPHGSAGEVMAELGPLEKQEVRNLEYDAERAAFFEFPYGTSWRFRLNKNDKHDKNDKNVELVESDIDANGQMLLRVKDRSATLFYSLRDGFFTTYDGIGATSRALQILRAALSRVPLDASESLSWSDFLPARPFRSWLGRMLSDVFSPFLHRDGIAMKYSLHRQGTTLVIEGISCSVNRRGTPLLRTRVELSREAGPLRALLSLRGQTFTLERESATPASIVEDVSQQATQSV